MGGFFFGLPVETAVVMNLCDFYSTPPPFLLHTDDRFVFFATFVTVHEFRFTEKEIHPRLLGMWKRRKVA
jgi:hypothetical protein